MNFMQKCKRNGGFTLVELIVVIAILAILAGVAVPAYTGYIKKAEEAADQQLLGAVNTAFAAACLEQGKDAADVRDADISLKAADSGEGNIVEKIAYVAGMDATVVDEAFQRYYAGNGASAFKVITQLDFVDGVFVDPANSDQHTGYTYNGETVYVAKKDIEAFTNSSWGTVASKDVLSLVGNVSDMAMNIDNEIFLGMLENPEYLNAAASALGMSAADYDANVTAMIENAAEEWKKNNPAATEEEIESYKETVGGQIVTNNAILVAAQNAQTAGSNIMSLLTADGGKDAKKNIAAAMSSDPATGLSQAALAYGLYSSYMLSTNPSSFDPEAPLDFSAVMNTMTEEGFQTYLTEGNGQKDLEGYLAALNTVSSNSSAVGSDVVVNGFDNDDLVALLQSAMGK